LVLILSDSTKCLPNRSADKETQPPAHPWRGYLLVAGATFCWAAAATAGSLAFSGEAFNGRALISPLVLTQTRTTFTVLLLFAFLLVRFGRDFFRISRRDLALCAMAGTLGTAGSNFFYYFAIQKATVAIAITLQYAAPVWVLLYMVLLGKQRLTLRSVGSVALAVVGIALTIGLFQSGLRLTLLGAGAALIASFCFALYNIAAPPLVRRNHPLKVMLYALLSAAVLWAMVNPPWRLLAANYNAVQWRFLFLFACFSMLLPYILFFHGLKYLDPTRAVIASCLEPVFAVLLAAVFAGQAVRGLQVAGILAVLGATVMVQAQPESRVAGSEMKDGATQS
jgi:drug/metabolite transporter (DMT)-like permease